MKVTDLVEENRAAVGRLELADLELVGPGEGASLVPEQLALQKLPGHRGAVDLDEWPGPARGEVMDRACDELLAGSRLARDEHGDVDAGRLAEDLARLQHLGAAPELHLASDPSPELLRSRAERLGLRANEIVDGLLKLVQVQRLVEHHVHLDRNGVETILAAVDDGDDGAGTPAVKLQTLNQFLGVGSVTAQIDQREAKASIRERLHGFVRGRDRDALVSADSQKAEKS